MKTIHAVFGALLPLVVVGPIGCGSDPPPKAEDPTSAETGGRRGQRPGATPQISQELGSIDQRKVEQLFANLTQGPLETCHKQGRDRVEFLTGDVKVFLRVDGNGRMKYGYFEETTLGDRDTEKCILGVFQNASWPKPQGGEAEIRNGFGWGPGGEREPTTWASDKVATALVEQKDLKKDLDRCKGSVKGDFRVTAYVEAGEAEESGAAAPKPKPKPTTAKGAKPVKTEPKEAGGKFKAIGVAPPNKEGAEKIDCIVDVLRHLDLPSPGSYAAKVSFAL